MADTVNKVLSSSEQIAANYEKYKDRFKDSTSELVNSQTFLSLLVAEMTNQDPLEPTSNTEFITQMAQFTSLQYAQDSSTYAKANYASSLVGKTVTASMMDGGELVTKTGVVEKVVKNGSDYTVYIDGKGFDISKVTSVADGASSGTTSSGSLGDRIAAASMMIGMYATVNAKTEKGTVVDAGIVESVQAKNGEISVVINGVSYKAEDVVEVKYATIPDDSTTDGTTDGKTDGATNDTTDKKAEETGAAQSEQMAAAFVEQRGVVVPEVIEDDIEDLEDLADIL